ncbi:MAG: hypothetical protein R2789_13285 [Microthrixaceae bacterium]
MAATVPPFLADENPATQQYLTCSPRHSRRKVHTGLGYNSFSAWLLFAQSVKSCDPTSRAYDAGEGCADWTGGDSTGPHIPHPMS